MSFTFPTNPSNNQIVITPTGQRYIFVSADDGWRSIGDARSPAGSAGVSISSTMFFLGAPISISLSATSNGTGNGVNPPYTFMVTAGNMPTGITLMSTGLLSGIPTVANELYTFTVSVLDSLSFLTNTIMFTGAVSTTLTAPGLLTILAPYALRNSPIFTGTPTAPTVNPNDNSLKIANTAFVASAINRALNNYSSLTQDVIRLQNAVNSNVEAINTETVNRDNAVSDLSVLITTALTSSTTITGPSGPISSLATLTETLRTATTDISALSEVVDTLSGTTVSSSGSTLLATLTTTLETATTNITSMSSQISALTASTTISGPSGPMLGSLATLSEGLTTTSSNVAALSSRVDTLTAAVTGPTGSNIASITSALNTATTNINAISSKIETLTSSSNGIVGPDGHTIISSLATLTQALTAQTTATTSQASQITELSATAQGLTASVAVNETAIATLDGYANASYGVTLDTNNYVTGFQVINGGEPGSSSFIIRADLFEVVAPGAAALPLFSVSDVHGVTTVSITGNIIENGVASITNVFPPQSIFFVNSVLGSDTTGNGITTGTAWATIQHAVNSVKSSFCSTSAITIAVAAGNYSAVRIAPSSIYSWNIVGAGSTQCFIDATTISSTSDGRGFDVSTNVNISGFSIVSYYENIVATGNSTCSIGDIHFNGTTILTAPSIGVYENARLNTNNCPSGGTATFRFSGWSGYMMLAQQSASILVGYNDAVGSYFNNFIFDAGCVFEYTTVQCSTGSSISFSPADVSFTNYSNISGTKFYVTSAGGIVTYGAGVDYLPGRAGTGVIQSPGYYL